MRLSEEEEEEISDINFIPPTTGDLQLFLCRFCGREVGARRVCVRRGRTVRQVRTWRQARGNLAAGQDKKSGKGNVLQFGKPYHEKNIWFQIRHPEFDREEGKSCQFVSVPIFWGGVKKSE